MMENETNDLTTLKPEYLTLPDTPDVKKNDLNYLMEYVCFYQRRYYMACRIPAPLWHHGRHSRNTSTSSSLPRTRYDKIRKETLRHEQKDPKKRREDTSERTQDNARRYEREDTRQREKTRARQQEMRRDEGTLMPPVMWTSLKGGRRVERWQTTNKQFAKYQ